MADSQSNINLNPKQLTSGMNLSSVTSQVKNGQTTWAINAVIINHDGNSIDYQNEGANELCAELPAGYTVIGRRNIIEEEIIIFWLLNEQTGACEIGKVENCSYTTLINNICLNFDINSPILKTLHRKNKCGETEVYWVESINRTRYINLSSLPFKIQKGENSCDDVITTEVDCNRLNLQPDFSIPQVDIIGAGSDGTQTAGTVQFAVQYTDKTGIAYTSFYSVTNPTPLYDQTKITLDFNYPVNKSIKIRISNIDTSGIYESINLAVVKTINNISTPELVGIYDITGDEMEIVYTGQSKTDIKLSIEEIFAKYDIYDNAKDITSAQDSLILADLTLSQRISYQGIASQIGLKWQTWRMPVDSFKDELVSTYLKGYMGDEVYPFEICFLLGNGVQTDGFHIPGRVATDYDLEEISNNDVVDSDAGICEPNNTVDKRWKVYNTASVGGYEQVYIDFLAGIASSECTNPKLCGIENIDPSDPLCYSGPFQYGEFAYWESTDTYPCNDIYGDLSGKPIRHHKFPDSIVSHIHDNQGFIYTKGIKINIAELKEIIRNSNLTAEEKANIKGFKILRGNRANSKSVVAKGLLYNVGKYIRDNETFFYPNYPFNDLRKDPFIDVESNYLPSTNTQTTDPRCFEYQVTVTAPAILDYTDCTTLQSATLNISAPSTTTVCSITVPEFQDGYSGVIIPLSLCTSGSNDPVTDEKASLDGFVTNDSKQRYTFHSPDTSFYQPFLGNILKLETAEYGVTTSHFTEVKNHAKYSFISEEAVSISLAVAVGIGFASNTVGVSTNIFNGTAAWTALQTMLELISKLLPNKNFAYQQNSVGQYVDYKIVTNSGDKQRKIDISYYLQPGMVNAGDSHTINNYQRESSIYLKTNKILPFPHTIPGVPEDMSRYTLSQEGLCDTPNFIKNKTISSYYSSIKNNIANQYGKLYSYETLDTGYQFKIDINEQTTNPWLSVYGGDIFINRFGLKRKFPYFIDNRVNPNGTNQFANNSDIFYNEIGNVGYPKYWFSTDIRKSGGGAFFGLFGVKETSFDCEDNKFFYNSGKMYLFNYGIPYFYCESEVNVDLRQATNTEAGDYYPRVSSGIPDDWLQETYVSINNDNTFYYNKTYSKQNKENLFTHLPENWSDDQCTRYFPKLVVFSDNWRVFKPSSKEELPSNYGDLISVDGIENKQVLVRFEQKTLLYNALLTAPTTAASVYLGQSLFSQSVPPLDYADTDIGYMGCQNKFLLKTEYGHISTDARRGQVFLINGQSAKDITADTETQKVEPFFNEFFNFHILSVNKNINVDNHYKDIGITGVYDTKYDRLILTKKDYKPKVEGIAYLDGEFYYDGQKIQLSDKRYFCNYSFTASYSFKTQSWVSFHTYIPKYYIGDSNFFYCGDNTGIWKHNTVFNKFNNYFGEVHPYIIEVPYSRQYNDEILQNIQDYSRIFKYTDWSEFIETDDQYFNKMVIYSNQQCSGILELVNKPKNNLSLASKYPIYNSDSKVITFVKSNSFYQINTFWDMVVDVKQPVWIKSCENLSIFKEINQDNMDYGKRSRKKSPFRSKELKIRYILDNRDDIKIISTFTTAATMQSYK